MQRVSREPATRSRLTTIPSHTALAARLAPYGLVAWLAACGRVGYAPTGELLATGVASGVDHTCAIVGGSLWCSGANASGQLGLRDLAGREAPTRVDGARDLVEVSAGYATTTLLDVDGDVLTLGANDRGQLGRVGGGGGVIGRADLPARALRVSQRFDHGCAILEDDTLWCWGSNFEGELGQDDPADSAPSATPLRVPLDLVFADVSAGQGHTCAITEAGALWCWGRNTLSELGLGAGTPIQIRRPTEVMGRRWERVVCGQSHTCAIDVDHDVYCWGADDGGDGHHGPVGVTGAALQTAPALVDDAGDWAALSSDTFHTCGIRDDGTLWCWGRNAEGQLALGDPTLLVDTPRRIGGDADWASVAVGRFTTCARKRDGRVFCAGDNRHGELGVGDRASRASLSLVRAAP